MTVRADRGLFDDCEQARLVAIDAARLRRGGLSAENDVGGMLGRLMFGDAVAERRQVDPGEHRFALPEHDRGQAEVQLVDQTGAEILTHRLDAAADLHVEQRRSKPTVWRREVGAVMSLASTHPFHMSKNSGRIDMALRPSPPLQRAPRAP